MRKFSITQCLCAPILATGIAGGAAAASLDVAIDSSPAGLDPHLITAFNSVVIVQSTIYEGLTAVQQDLSVGPGLAESWDVSDDSMTYTFNLADNVTFHDGSSLDAEDVAASIRRVQSEEIASPLASRVSPITEITIVDPQTIQLSLDAPFAAILSSLSGIAIVPAEFETDTEALQKVPVGSGPFKFNEWTSNSHISLVKFDQYRVPGLPKLDEVKINFVPESATRQVGLGNGDYDILPGIDPATALQLQANPNTTLHQTQNVSYTLLGMNTSRGALGDPRVRTAINKLLDREEIIAGALFGAGVPAGPLSPALATWALDSSEYECYGKDIDGAKALLKDAGAENIELSILVLPRQDAKDIAQVIEQQLAAGGISVTLQNKEIGEFVQDWKNSNFDLFVSANGGSPDPDEYFYRTFKTGGSTNVFKYSDNDIDAWLDEGRSLTDPSARKVVYDKVQRKLACEGPIAHIAYGNLTTAVRNSVTGFQIHPTGRLASLIEVTAAN